MATFADLGNMRAKLDTRTGMIRITSGDKDSPLRKEGFVLNVSRGTKEYTSLLELIASQGASAAEGTEQEEYQLPKIVHMGEKYHSEVPERIPLGVLADRSTLMWDVDHHIPHMAISGATGSGKTMFVATMLYHLNRHRATTRAYVSSPVFSDTYLDLLTLPDENIDINEDSAEYIRRAHSMMCRRFEYMAINQIGSIKDEIAKGEMKRVFLIIDGYYKESLSSSSGDNDESTQRMLQALLREGRAAGIHVVLTSQRPFNRTTELGTSVVNNALHVDFSHTGEGLTFFGEGEEGKRFRALFIKSADHH